MESVGKEKLRSTQKQLVKSGGWRDEVDQLLLDVDKAGPEQSAMMTIS